MGFAMFCWLQRCAIDDDNSYGQAPAKEPKPEPVVGSNKTKKIDVGDEGDSIRGAETSTDEHHRDEKRSSTKAPTPPVFAKRLSCKWTTGFGPRIGCVRDYPTDLQSKALEQVNLSPRVTPGFVKFGPIPSPRPSPRIHLSPRIAGMGLPSPRPIATTN